MTSPTYHFSRIHSLVGNSTMRVGQTANELKQCVVFYQSPNVTLLYFDTRTKCWESFTDTSNVGNLDTPTFTGHPMQPENPLRQIPPTEFCLPEFNGWVIEKLWSGKYCIHALLTKGLTNPIPYKEP